MTDKEKKPILQEKILLIGGDLNSYHFLSHGVGWTMFIGKIKDGHAVGRFPESSSIDDFIKYIIQYENETRQAQKVSGPVDIGLIDGKMVCPHCGKQIVIAISFNQAKESTPVR